MEEIQKRLQETSQECLKTHEEWTKKKDDKKAQEALHNAIHELRKVSSRLEIELAVSERDHLASKPLPIPSHKATQKGAGGTSILDNGDNDDKKDGPVVQKSAPRRRRPHALPGHPQRPAPCRRPE